VNTISSQPAALQFDKTNRWEDCKRICRTPDVVLDCGANLGQAARNLREAYPDATIYSFEPVAHVFEKLRPTADELNVIPVQAAVSDRTGTSEIHLTESHESNSLLGFLEHDNPLERYHRVRGVERVQTWRLDDWALDARIAPQRIDVLKLDVQGAELMALEGAKTILPTVKLVLMEVALVPYYADCPLFDEVEAYMQAEGFERKHLYAAPMPDIWADAIYVRK